jgi:hypothetical protein
MSITRRTVFGLSLTLLSISFLVGLALPVFAADSATATISSGLKAAGDGTYSDDLTVTVFVGRLIKVILSLTGVVFLGLTVYAGILYMTAAGEPDKIKKAKAILTNSVIGLLIIVGAYALTSYVVDAVTEVSTSTSTTSP